MKRFSEQFKKQADRVVMRSTEKNELKARIVSYMEYHPLPKEVTQKRTIAEKVTSKDAIVSEPFFSLSFNSFPMRSFAGFFVLFVVVGIPLVAEKALPGDVLYPVKVQFTEEVRSSLSFSPYAKVEWETERLERRIAEARLLASEGKLTDEAQAVFAEAVKVHTDAAQREIAELKESDTDSAAIAEIAFASALEVQAQVLEGHIENESSTTGGSEDGHSILALVEVVAEARSSAEAAQTDAKPSYEKLLATVEEESTHVYELFESIRKSASADEIMDIERRFEDVERNMRVAIAYKEGTILADEAVVANEALAMSKQGARNAHADAELLTTTADADIAVSKLASTEMAIEGDLAMSIATATEVSATSVQESIIEEVPVVIEPEVVVETELTTHSEAEAIEMLRATLKDIQKLLNYLTNIDVRENVSIDDLVPVTPTIDEKAQEVMRLFDAALAVQKEVKEKNIPRSLRGKVAQGMQSLDLNFETITAAMEIGDLETALIAATEAQVIATDLQVLTASENIVAPVETPVTEITASTSEVVTE